MFRRAVEGHVGENFVKEPLEALGSKESKPSQIESNYSQRPLKKYESIRRIIALPNDRLLIHVKDTGNDSLEIYDIHTKSLIKKIEPERMKSCELLSDKELAIYRYDENALIYDLDLNYLATITPSYHLWRLVEFNKDIVIGHGQNERNNEIFTRSGDVNTYGSEREFLEAVGYDKIGFLTPLGNNKILAAYDDYLRIIESKNESFKRIGEMNFDAKDEGIYSASKISDDRFAVVTTVSNTIFTKVKKEVVQHLRIYDTNTLQCIDDIILPKSASVEKIEMLPDGKTVIGWGPLMKPNKIYEINLETHAQKTIVMPKRVTGLTVLSNGNIAVLLDYKNILELELEQIKQFKKDAKQEIALQLDKSTSLVKNVAGIIASYSASNVLKLPLSKQNEIDSETLKQEINQKIKYLSDLKLQFFIKKQLSILRVCQHFLEKNICDEKEFVTALAMNKYASDRGKKNSISHYVNNVLTVMRRQNENKKLQGSHLKS